MLSPLWPRRLLARPPPEVVKAVAVLIGFLIGLFLSACVNRWHAELEGLAGGARPRVRCGRCRWLRRYVSRDM